MKAINFRAKNIRLSFFLSVLCAVLMGATQVQASWTTGGPYGGYINCLVMATTNSDIIYAGTASGLFKTTNGGDNWTKTGFPQINVRVVQVAPDNPDIVYAGTDDGIFKTEDGGSTWTQKGLSGARVNAIAIDPNNANILYAGTGKPRSSYDGEIVGIFKSTDGGETWKEKLSDPDPWGLDAVSALLIDTDNSAYIYAGVSGGDGFRKSTDRGETWVSRQVGNDDLRALAMTPAGFSPATIYAAVNTDDVYKSTDRGGTWEATEIPPRPWSDPCALAVDPNDPNVIYVATCFAEQRFLKSPDGGDTWSVKANGLPQAPSTIVIDPRNSDIYVGLGSYGIYKSTDEAESWNPLSQQGMINTYIEDLAIHPTSSDTAFAAVKGGGYHLAKTTNGGSSWDYLVNSPTNLGAVTIDSQNPSTIWVGEGYHYGWDYYVYKTSDGGHSWTTIHIVQLTGGYNNNNKISDILVKVDDSDSILVGAERNPGFLVLSTDGGKTWEGDSYIRVTALAADPNNPNVVYWGKRKIGQVFRHPNIWEGNVWNHDIIDPPEGIGDVRDIEVDSDSQVYVAASDGLWRWDGSGWITLNGLPSDDITALAIDRSTSPGIVYVGTGEDGVFVSQDGGSTWKPFNEGLENLSITKLAISASLPKMLYAGTAYGGVWSKPIPSYLLGDVSGDGTVGLEDAILALHVLSGIASSQSINLNADVNGDGRIGLEEVIYILQKVSGLR